jgi:type II secretory pathway pseudopilin PulG
MDRPQDIRYRARGKSVARRTLASTDGFTVAEMVVAIAILLIIAVGVLGSLAYANASSRMTATREKGLEIANQQLEKARNMPFDDVGTVNGNPGGTIPDTQYADANGSIVSAGAKVYTIDTVITWAPDEMAKRIQVTVSWENPTNGHVTVESSIIGKSTAVNAGTVEITVKDGDTGVVLQGVSITLAPNTGRSSTGSTGADGKMKFLKIAAGSFTLTQGSKSGYVVDIAAINATSPQVVANQTNSFIVNAYKLSTGVVMVKDTFNNPMQGVSVYVKNTSLNTTLGPVTSDSTGKATFEAASDNGLRVGTWNVSGSGAGYLQSASTALVVSAPGGTYTGTLTMVKIPVLTVTVKGPDGQPVPGATLSAIANANLSGPTDSNGQATYWFLAAKPSGASFTVTKTGYNTATSNSGVIVMGVDPTPVTVNLTYSPIVLTVTVKNSSGTALSGVTLSAVSGAALSGVTNSSGQATYTFTSSQAAQNFTATLSGYVTRTSSTGAIVLGQAATPVVVTLYRKPTLTVTVNNQFGTAVSGATLSPIAGATLSGTTNSSGQATYTFDDAQAATAYTVSKTGHTTASAVTPAIAVDQALTQSAAVGNPLPAPNIGFYNLMIPFKFVATDPATVTIYIFTRTGTSTGTLYTSVTVAKPSPLGTGVVNVYVPLLAARYHLSTANPFKSTKLTLPSNLTNNTVTTYPATTSPMTTSN